MSAETTVTAVPTAADPADIPEARHARKIANLRPPWKKGNVPVNRKRPHRLGNKRLEEVIRARLQENGGERLEKLGLAIIRLACKGNAAALNLLVPRLWPLLQDQNTGKVIVQGIRLEVSPAVTVSLPGPDAPNTMLDQGLSFSAVPSQVVTSSHVSTVQEGVSAPEGSPEANAASGE